MINLLFLGCITMVRKSKVETSPHYNEIVDLLVAGYSPRYVSDYLSNEYDEKISHNSLNRYRKNNLNVKAAVKQKIIEKEKQKIKSVNKQADKEIKAQESFEIAADYRFKDIQKLDDLIANAKDVEVNLDNIQILDENKYDPYREQSLKIQYKKLALDAMKLKYELIDEDELNVNVQNENVIGLADSIEKSRQKYLKEIENK